MSTNVLRGEATQIDRRTHPHLRAIYADARVRIDHFFQNSHNWAGTPIDYLALRVIHEVYPDLPGEHVRLLIRAIERQYGQQAVSI